MFCERELGVLGATSQRGQCTDGCSDGSRRTDVQVCNTFVCAAARASGGKDNKKALKTVKSLLREKLVGKCAIVRRMSKLQGGARENG